MIELLQSLGEAREGQALEEYTLIIALVAVGLIMVMILYRDELGGAFDWIAQLLNDAPQNQAGTA